MPSHLLAALSVPPVQPAAPHWVPAGKSSHAPVPRAQVPLVPHDAAPWSGHAAAQQTPFDPQTPLVQSDPPPAALHPVPGPPSPTHIPPVQWLPLAQSAPEVQLVLQLVPLQRYAPHDIVVDPAQVPLPSHWPAVLSIPPAQEASTQAVPIAQCSQAPP
jgi:hypothetical protein